MSEKLPDIVKAIISHDTTPFYKSATLMIISGKTVLVKIWCFKGRRNLMR